MRPASLVGRLLLSAVIGVLAASVAAGAVVAAYLHLRNTDAMVGREAEEELDDIERDVRTGADDRLSVDAYLNAVPYDALRKDMAFRIVDANGRTLFASPAGPALHAMDAMAPGTRTLDMSDGEMTVRLQVRERRIVRGGREYLIQAVRSNRFEERLGQYARHRYLDSALVSALVALAVFALVVCCVTMQRVVVPLRRASAIAARIGPRTLSARLHVEGIPSEMTPLIDALNSALERVEQGFKVQQDFIAMAAHELKTPLALLQAEVELGGEMNKAAMLRETQLMARQVNQLLHLAEVSEGRNYRFFCLSLWASATDAVGYLTRLAERNGVSLRLDRQGPETWVDADEGAMFVMLKNLLENAIHHSPPGSVVTLEASPGGFAVIDQGAGVSAANREHLFKRFWRGSNAGGGAGLGLAIVREICLAHQWDVRFEEAEGGGARFVVAIVATEAQVDA